MPGPQPAPHAAARRRRTPLLGRSARHLVGRFSYGLTPGLARQVIARGGARDWFEWQLRPERIRDRGVATLDEWWPGLQESGAAAWRRHAEEIEPGWVQGANYQRWVLQRRIRSNRQLLEVMTEFWEHHLHVPANGEPSFPFRRSYGDAVRAHALGRFEDLLQATITHPAMLVYLDQAVSTARHPNENLAREMLELHTVGRDHYDESDVKDTARVLTGWRVDIWRSWEASYETAWHATGPVRVLGFTHPNDRSDGRPVTRQLLTHLARHPMTAQRLARKLASKFVHDDPPESLVSRLARVYLDHDTGIAPVLRALVRSDEFRTSADRRIRTPLEDLVGVYRVLGIRMTRPTAEDSAANAVLWQAGSLGAHPFGWPRPDGMPQSDQAWASPARMLASMQAHYTLSGGWWPTRDVRYRRPAAWAPSYPIRFEALVDHLSRQLLHQRATPHLHRACQQATGVAADEQITRDHGLVQWGMPRLLTTLLDSPDFFSR